MTQNPVRDIEPRGRSGVDVYGILRAKILDLQLPPDGKVNIDALARELGVSQTPIREALSQLEGDRLIVKTPGKGYRTTALLGTAELRELFEFRLLVEPWAARAAAVNRLVNPARILQASLTAACGTSWWRTIRFSTTGSSPPAATSSHYMPIVRLIATSISSGSTLRTIREPPPWRSTVRL
jgi:DNA-binding FadR family transcriptional regulator